MICTHVLGLIDAGPFADYPRAHLEAAWQHARQCATCGPAFATATALSADLTALPLPEPPPDLRAAVLARIERIEETPHASATVRTAGTDHVLARRDWYAWTTAFGGLAATLAIAESMPNGDEVFRNLASFRAMTASAIAMPAATISTFVLAAGLAVYLTGLFGPLRDSSRPIREEGT